MNGYIYVLVNPAMPGLAKVGKTGRNPSERSSELSSATGVPSPFIVVFQQPVPNIDFAEHWVHQELERMGNRHSSSREFFNAPLHEVVAVVSKCAQLTYPTDAVTHLEIHEAENTDDLAEQLFEIGEAFEHGTSTTLPNSVEAVKFYEQAAALNHRASCLALSNIYQRGTPTVRKDLQKALIFEQKSANMGWWFSHANMANIFFKTGQYEHEKLHRNVFFDKALTETDSLAQVPDLDRAFVEASTAYFVGVGCGAATECVDKEKLNLIAPKCIAYILEKIIAIEAAPDDKLLGAVFRNGLSVARRYV